MEGEHSACPLGELLEVSWVRKRKIWRAVFESCKKTVSIKESIE